MNRLYFAVATTLLALGAISPAHAQFVGDVYFLQPSAAIPSGQTGDLDLAIFTGDKAFGATSVTLTFDPAKITVEAVFNGTNGDDILKVQSLSESGSVKIISLNASALQRPFGSVAIAKIRVRMAGSPGERAVIHSSVTRALFADRAVMRAGTGFDAEITIGQPPSASSSQAVLVANQSPLGDRARRLRPAGSEVRLITRLSNGKIGEVRVKTSGTSTVRD